MYINVLHTFFQPHVTNHLNSRVKRFTQKDKKHNFKSYERLVRAGLSYRKRRRGWTQPQ